MSNTKILNAAIESFRQKFEEFCQNQAVLIDKLDSDAFNLMTRALMDAAQAAGKDGLSEFLRQHDVYEPSITQGTTFYRYKGTSNNELLTLFGTINIDRAMYYNEKEGGSYFFPLDKALGLEKNDFATLETREMILFATASCVPRELSILLGKCSLCNPSTTAIQNIINKDGAVMDELSEKISTAVIADTQVPDGTHALVVSLDGANVLLREPGQKKGRKNKRPVECMTTSSTTSYHNAMVGAVSFYGTNDAGDKPQRLSSLYTARMPEEKSVTFKKEFELMLTDTEAKFTEAQQPVCKILLTDAHLMIKGFAQSSKVLNSYEMLVDFFHVTEHLSKAADAAYGEQTDWSKWYYNKWCEALKTEPDAPKDILRSLRGLADRHELSAKRKKELETEITFFKNNKHLMKYADFIKRKLPIGSGPIEAAAKTIIKQRMCRSGMRWSRTKGQYVLAIRAIVQSGTWESAWNIFKELKKAA
jgi:hypothetical protein